MVFPVISNNNFTGSPTGWDVEASLDGNKTFTNIQRFTTRSKTVTITRAGAQEAATMQMDLWNQLGGFPLEPVVPDFAKIHVWDRYSNPAAPYPRYFNGFVISQRPTYDGNLNEAITLECVGVDWLLDNPPGRVPVPLMVGAAPEWLPGHTYAVGDYVSSYPDNGHNFKCITAGISNANTQPTWNVATGANTNDGTVVWQESGDSSVTDKDVWNNLLPYFFPEGEITWGANVHALITSVQGFQVTPAMTPRDVAKLMIAQVSNRGYYATYDPRAASTAYNIGDLIEQSPSVHGIIWQCTVAGTTPSGAAPAALTTTTALGVSIADGPVRWRSYKWTGRWEGSITMTLGQRVEPQTGSQNGLYYQVITAGTTDTAVNAPGFGTNTGRPWPTTIGQTVQNGSVLFRCQGTTSIAPICQLWTPLDNAGHTASWVADFAWIDSNDVSGTQVQQVGPHYTDVNPQDSTHIHWSDMTLNRDGQNGYANRWYVQGKNNAFAQVDDLGAQHQLGIIVSKSYSDTSDTGPSDQHACDAVGQGLLASSIVRETVQITAPDILDPVMIQKLTTCQINASLLGIGPPTNTYPSATVSVSLSDAGAKWELMLGAGFLTDRQDPYSNVRSSRRIGSDLTPPALVTWPSNWVVANSVDVQSPHLVSLTVCWQEDSPDTSVFSGYYTLNGDAGHYFPNVTYPTTNMTIRNLPRNTVIQFYMAATDHNLNVRKDPLGNYVWSVSPTVTTGDLPAAPHPPDIGTIAQVHDAAGYHIQVPVQLHNPPPGTPPPPDDAWNGGSLKVVPPTGPIIIHPIPSASAFPFIVTHNVLPNNRYFLSAEIIDSYFQHSGFSTPTTSFLVLSDVPNSPTKGTITQYRDSTGYHLVVPIVMPNPPPIVDASGGIALSVSIGGIGYLMNSGPNPSLPYSFNIGPVQSGAVYIFRAAITNQYGEQSPFGAASSPYTVQSSVAPNTPTLNTPILGAGQDLNGYVAAPVVNKGVGPGGTDVGGGGIIYWVATADGSASPFTYSQVIPAGAAFPFTGKATRLAPNVTYTFTCLTIDSLGTRSAVSAPITYRVSYPHPNIQPGPLKWAGGHLDQVFAGWLPSIGANSDFSLVPGQPAAPSDAPTTDVSTYIQVNLPAGLSRAINSMPISCRAGEVVFFEWNGKADTAGVVNATLSVQPQYWGGDIGVAATNVGAALQVGGVQSLGNDYSPTAFSGSVVIPSGAKQFVLILLCSNTSGSTPHTAYMSYPDQAFDAVQIADGAVGTSELANGSVTSVKLANGALYDFSTTNMVLKSSGFTADANNKGYNCFTATGFTASLPSAATCPGRVYYFKSSNTGVITITPAGSEKIDNMANFPLAEQFQAVAIMSDGANWQVVAQAGLFLTNNGTNWLGPEVPFEMHNLSGLQPVTGTPVEVLAGAVNSIRPFFLTRWDAAVLLTATNTTGQFWTLNLRHYVAGVGFTTCASRDTHTFAASTWNKFPTITTFTAPNPIAASDFAIEVQLAATSGPSGISVVSQLFGRYVYG